VNTKLTQEKIMKLIVRIASCVLLFLFGSVVLAGNKTYTVTLKVQEEQNIQSQYASMHFGWSGGNGGGAYGHKVSKHVFAVGTDNNAYDLIPTHQKDLLLPGSYQARFDKHNVILLVNGHEVKMLIVDVKTLPAEPDKVAAKQ
jgi:hypothetical protein